MNLFLSHFTNRLDAKGRVSIPAAFRTILGRDGFEGLYVYQSLEAQALDCGGNALLARITGVLAGLAPFSEAHDSFSTALLGQSEVLKLDSEGRIVLPESLKSHAGISQDVTFVGLGEKFQIWQPGRFQAHLAQAKMRLLDLRQQTGSKIAAELPYLQGARQ